MTDAQTFRARIRIAREQGRGGITLGLIEAEEIAELIEIASRNKVVIPLKSRNPATAKWANRVKLEIAE